MSWRPPEYPWQKEYYEWAQRQPREPIEMLTVEERRAKYPKANMSDLVRVVYDILEKPEIMAQWEEYAKRVKSGESFDHYEDDQYKYACQLVGDYYNWHRMKNDISTSIHSYQRIPSIIRRIVLGELGEKDIAAVKKHLVYNDDVHDDLNFGKKK